MRRRLTILLFVLLTPVVLLCLFLLFERIRGQISLTSYKRELIAKGEKLTFAELIPPVPKGENGAPQVIEAYKRLQKGAAVPDNSPPAMRLTPFGHAIVGFREKEWIYDKVTNNWEQVAADLKVNEAMLAEIHAALAKSVLNNNLDYKQGYKMKLLHLSPPKSATFWLTAAAQHAIREGRNKEAIENLVADIRLARTLAEDRTLISELVRIAIAAISRTATWEAMQANGWSDGQLASLQEVWFETEFASAMVKSLEGERAFGESVYEPLRHSNEEAVQVFYWNEIVPSFVTEESPTKPWWQDFMSKEVYCRIWRFAWSHQDERHYLEGMSSIIEINRNTVAEKSYAKATERLDRFHEETLIHHFYGDLRFRFSDQSLRSMAFAIKRAMRAETERSLVVCAIALKRYSIHYGRFPAALDNLVPEFLPSVPIDYMDGKPMKYRLNADGSFTLYSVGEDGKDDGGNVSLLPDKKCYRNLWDTKDCVWPAVATPEEVEAWRKETANE